MRRTNFYSKINSSESTISSFKDIPKDIQEIRVLHSALVSMEGIEIFKLKIINLSSNHIQRMQGLEHMKSLQQLTLSNNKIRVIEGVSHLVNLERLSIKGLQSLSNNPSNKLKILDLRGNLLSQLGDLSIFTGFGKLQQLMMDIGKASNPMCQNRQEYHKMLLKHVKPSIKKIDNLMYEQIEKSFYNCSKQPTQQKQNYNSSNIQQTRYIQQPQSYGATKLEILQLEKIISYKDLIIQDLKAKNLQSASQLNQNYKDYLKIQYQAQRMSATNQELERQISKKNKEYQQLQSSLNDTIRENGKLSKDIYSKNLQMEKYVKDMGQLRIQNAEYRAVVKDNDKKMNELHSKTLQSVNSNSAKIQQIKNKYQKLYTQHHSVVAQNNNLKLRVQELNEICRQWEFKYERAYQEYIHNIQKELRKQQGQYDKRIQNNERIYKQNSNSKQMQFKRQLAIYEQQFKKSFEDLRQKYKRTQKDNVQLLKINNENKLVLSKNAELQFIISQTQGVLQKIRKDHIDTLHQKDIMTKEVQRLHTHKNQEVTKLAQQRDKLSYERSYMERELTNMRQKIVALQFELEQGTKIQQLNNQIQVKNQMLDDKNETIQSLKQEIKQLRKQQSQAQLFRGKYEDKKTKLKQLQRELQAVLTENQQFRDRCDQLQAQLQTTKQQLTTKQENLNKIQNYLNDFSSSLKQKDDNISELMEALQQSKGVITRKTQETEMFKREAESLKRDYFQKYQFYKNRENKFESNIQSLHTKIESMERQKIESQKNMKAAKEHFQSFAKLFSK